MDGSSDPERSKALEDYKNTLLQSREVEAKLKTIRLDIKGLQKDFDTTEDNIKALQSVGQIIGEVLKQLDEERFIVKASSGPRYVVGCRSKVDKAKLKQGTRVALDMTTLTIMRMLPREVDPLVYNMSLEDPGQVSFGGIGGLNEQIRELREVIELPLKNPELFLRVGIKPPKGVLLYGPPGTGKTLLARAVASGLETNFLKVVSSAIVDKYIGESARLIREMFGYAKEHEPCIIFMDEIDAIGGRRFSEGTSADREIQRTLMELLNQLDGFDYLGKTKIIMATNRPDTLDPALLRAGRLDRKIEIPLPNEVGRLEILKIHTSGVAMDGEIDFESVVKMSDQLNGADLRNVVTEAGLFAIKDYRDSINQDDMNKAVRKVAESKKLEGKLEYQKLKELPMYKDKPYNYAASRRKPLYKRWRFTLATLALLIGLLYWIGIFSSPSTRTKVKDTSKSTWSWLNSKPNPGGVDWDERREKVKEAFTVSWDAYEKYAWGSDLYLPNSKKGAQMTDSGMGWIIIDALDTLMIMNLTSRLSHARDWMTTSLNYDQDQEVNTFETTIRMLGGLLSAHYLSTAFPDMAPLTDDDQGAPGEDLYLEKATDLADRLLGAFDSDSGVPYASVNLRSLKGIQSHADGGASSTAEATSLQLEFKYLASLTGEKDYWEKAEKVMKVVDDNGMEDGLLPIFIYAHDGTFRGGNIRLGSRGDSYYEYLIKQYHQTSYEEPIYLDLWNQALAGVRKHLITYSKKSHFTILAERPNGLEAKLQPKMDHLVCFMPGTIASATTGGKTVAEAKKAGKWGKQEQADLDLAVELTKTCWGMYKMTATGLAPEITFFEVDDPPKMEVDGPFTSAELVEGAAAEWKDDYIIKSQDAHNLQRPETVETLFYMWRITGDVKYREWGWEMFKSFVNYTQAEGDGGYTSLASVLDAETLKYFYLLFSPAELLPLDSVVFNTEGHVLPRFKLVRGLKTGWERKPRDKDGKIVEEKMPRGEHEKGEDEKKIKEEVKVKEGDEKKKKDEVKVKEGDKKVEAVKKEEKKEDGHGDAAVETKKAEKTEKGKPVEGST
ncbi:MAG: hypothetical protein LQ350_005200 [Teloschistes chrysophthalmus]|nr:MAG: hypothetical protein LQ350_005200 [Niorma chrysophthalma]